VENVKTGTTTPARRIMGNHQLIIITRLLQVVETLKTIDELFTWLSEMIMERMNVQVVQFWAMQAYLHGRMHCELRTMASQNTSFPHHIVVNQPLADTVEQLLAKQQSITPHLVGSVFSEHHSKLLIRYNLNYWGCHFMSNSILLPPTTNNSAHEKIATPLTLGLSVFMQHPPSSRLLPTLAHLLDHTLPIAKSRGLLTLPPPRQPGLLLTTSQNTTPHPIVTETTPYHTQTGITAKYALLPGSMMHNKNARHLYLAIDGQKTIGELASCMQLSKQEFYAALSFLLEQKRIQLFEPDGRKRTDQQPLQSVLIPRVH
jgi:hypothetical protein